MAKKAPGRKRGKSKKKNKQSGINLFILLTIGLVVITLVFYGLYQTNQLSETDYLETEHPDSKKSAGSTSPDQAEKEPDSFSEKSSESKFDRKDISAQDGQQESEALNTNLTGSGKTKDYYFTSSFDFGWPGYSQKDDIVEHAYFTLSYNEKQEQPDWVAYKLTRADLKNARYKRKNNFRADPDVKTKSASLADYKGSGYDRGHLAPAADFTWTALGLDESFYMSNMSPQLPGFNRGIWKKLEAKVRSWAKQEGELFVVTGPIFGKNKKTIGKNNVGIPSHYYKALLDISGNDVKGIAFVLPHEKSGSQLSTFAMSIDQLEKTTGLDFYPLLPDDLEDEIESQYDYADW